MLAHIPPPLYIFQRLVICRHFDIQVHVPVYLCTYSMFYEYDILPLICFEIMYILHINIIWLQMLLCMPESFVCDYRPLVSEPKLMLEQLLMNMKVWVPAVQKTYMVCLFFLFSLFKQIRVGKYQWQPQLFFFKSTKID